MLIWAVLYLFYWNNDESEEWTEKYIYIVSYSSRNNNTTREKFKRHKIILNSKGDKSGKKNWEDFLILRVRCSTCHMALTLNPIVTYIDF